MMNCDWGMIVAIISANIALTAIIVTFNLWIFGKLDGDIKSLGTKLDAETKAITTRTDQLYQMFIDLLRNPPKTNP